MEIRGLSIVDQASMSRLTRRPLRASLRGTDRSSAAKSAAAARKNPSDDTLTVDWMDDRSLSIRLRWRGSSPQYALSLYSMP